MFLSDYPFAITQPGDDFRIPAGEFRTKTLYTYVGAVNRRLKTNFKIHQYEDGSWHIWNAPIEKTEQEKRADEVFMMNLSNSDIPLNWNEELRQIQCRSLDYYGNKARKRMEDKRQNAQYIAPVLRFLEIEYDVWNEYMPWQKVSLRESIPNLPRAIRERIQFDEDKQCRQIIDTWSNKKRDKVLLVAGFNVEQWEALTGEEQVKIFKRIALKLAKWESNVQLEQKQKSRKLAEEGKG